jgi:hypothetical protein
VNDQLLLTGAGFLGAAALVIVWIIWYLRRKWQ